MTEQELKAIPFHFVSSLAMEHEHAISYESEDGRLGFCDHTIKRENGTFGRSYRHWRIEDKVYKTREKFLAALADYNPSVVSIRHRPYQNVLARMKHQREANPPATVVDMHRE